MVADYVIDYGDENFDWKKKEFFNSWGFNDLKKDIFYFFSSHVNSSFQKSGQAERFIKWKRQQNNIPLKCKIVSQSRIDF